MGTQADQTSFPSRLHFLLSGLKPPSSLSLNLEFPSVPGTSSPKNNHMPLWTSQSGTASIYQADPRLPWVSSSQGLHFEEGTSPAILPVSASEFLDLNTKLQMQSHSETSLHRSSPFVPLVSCFQGCHFWERPRMDNHFPSDSVSEFPDLDITSQLHYHSGTSLHHFDPFLPLVSTTFGLHLEQGPRAANFISNPDSVSNFLDVDSMPQFHLGTALYYSSLVVPPGSSSEFLGLNSQRQSHSRTFLPHPILLLPSASSSRSLHLQEGTRSATLHSIPGSPSQLLDLDNNMSELPSYTRTSFHHATLALPLVSSCQELHFGEEPRLANFHCPPGPAPAFLDLDTMPQLNFHPGTALHHTIPHLPLASSSGSLCLGNGSRQAHFHYLLGSASQFLDLDTVPQLQSHLYPGIPLYNDSCHLPLVNPSRGLHYGEEPRQVNLHSLPGYIPGLFKRKIAQYTNKENRYSQNYAGIYFKIDVLKLKPRPSNETAYRFPN